MMVNHHRIVKILVRRASVKIKYIFLISATFVFCIYVDFWLLANFDKIINIFNRSLRDRESSVSNSTSNDIGSYTGKSFQQPPLNGSVRGPAVLLNVKGGLGNQLFQYACSYALSRKYNLPLYILRDENGLSNLKMKTNNLQNYGHEGFNILQSLFRQENREITRRQFALNNFKIPLGVSLSLKNLTFASSVMDITDQDILASANFPENEILQLSPRDYCQSEVFFAPYKKEILQLFKFQHEKLSKWTAIIGEASKKFETVFVHVRLGDFLKNKNAKGISFYENAMASMIKLLEDRKSFGRMEIVFFIFSDDIQYVKRHLFRSSDVNIDFKKFKIHFVSEKNATEKSAIEDLQLMTKCRHGIISQSSFGWWAAYLIPEHHGKIIIAARYKLRQISGMYFKWQYRFLYYPVSWLQMD